MKAAVAYLQSIEDESFNNEYFFGLLDVQGSKDSIVYKDFIFTVQNKVDAKEFMLFWEQRMYSKSQVFYATNKLLESKKKGCFYIW